MSSITEFLEARISEDEASAGSGWSRLGDARWETDNYGRTFLSPSAALAECAAKRAILEAHPIVHDVVEVSTRIKWGFACETCFSYGDIVEDHGYCDTLRALAAVYKDHKDYRQEWAL